MKKLILSLLIFINGFGFSQDINKIKKIVTETNKTKNLIIKTVPYSYFIDKNQVTDNGIELNGFYKNKNLLKMEHWVGLSAWNIVTEYFFRKTNSWYLFNQ